MFLLQNIKQNLYEIETTLLYHLMASRDFDNQKELNATNKTKYNQF